jgi:hypothetical protein
VKFMQHVGGEGGGESYKSLGTSGLEGKPLGNPGIEPRSSSL